MRNSKKQSTAKSKKKSKKNPLRKYQTAGTPTLGSNAYSGNDMTLMTPISPGPLPTTDIPDVAPMTADVSPVEGISASAAGPSAGAIGGSVAGALSGIGSSVMAGMEDTSVKDPNGYFNKSTLDRIERSRKGAKAAGVASGIGTTISSIAPMTGPAAPFLLAIGALTTAGSEIGKAVHKGKEKKSIGDYDKLFADRQKYKERQSRRKQQNLETTSNINYYDQGSGLSRNGGLPKMKSGGPMYMEKYGVGGLSRVHGPTHEQGGIPVAFNSNPQDGGPQIVPKESGMAEGELEDNEIIDQTNITQEILREGGVKSGTYMFSEHVGVDGKKGKNKKSLSYADARGKVEKMNLPRDMKKNVIRDLMNNQAEDTNKPERFGNGGMMKYQKGGNEKEVLSSDISKVLQNDTLNPDFIRRPLSIDDSKVWQDDDLSPDFINKEKQAKVYKENSIPEKKNGGLMKYQQAGLEKAPKNVGYTGREWQEPGSTYYEDVYRTGKDGLVNYVKPDKRFVHSTKPGSTRWVTKEGNKTPFQDYLSQPSMQGRGRMASDTLMVNDPRRFDIANFSEKDSWQWGAPESRSGDDAALAEAFKKTYGSLDSLKPGNKVDPIDQKYLENRRDPKQQQSLDKEARFYSKAKQNRNGGLLKYKDAGILNTKTGQVLREYGPGIVNTIGEGINVGMTLAQKYNPVETINARELTPDQINLTRATDTLKGSRESNLINAKKASRAITGTGATQRENALRVTSLRAQEEAENAIRETNRITASDEAKINLAAVQQADEGNRQTDILRSESRRNEGLRKESFENMRKKYIGSVASEWGKTAADQMLKKEYIDRTLPPGVNMYEVNLNRALVRIMQDNPKLGYTEAYAKAMEELKAAKK